TQRHGRGRSWFESVRHRHRQSYAEQTKTASGRLASPFSNASTMLVHAPNHAVNESPPFWKRFGTLDSIPDVIKPEWVGRLRRNRQGFRSSCALPVSRSLGTEMWSCTFSQVPLIFL